MRKKKEGITGNGVGTFRQTNEKEGQVEAGVRPQVATMK